MLSALAKGLAPLRRLDGRTLVALDGTEHFHQMLTANVVAPGRSQASVEATTSHPALPMLAQPSP